MKKLVSDNTPESADAEYRYYRESGTGLSATIIAFSTVMIGWSLDGAKNLQEIQSHYYFQIGSYLLAVIFAFMIQVFHYFGYQKQARRNYHSNITMDDANCMFLRMDICVTVSCFALAAGFGATLATWFLAK